MNNRTLVATACLLALVACSRESAAPPPAPAAGTAPAGAITPAAAPVTTVAAVREGTGDAAIKVRFLMEKPMVVGQEGQLRLDFSSYISSAVTVDVKYEGDQLKLQPGTEVASVSLPRSGEEFSQTLAVTPLVAGLAELKIHVKIAGEDGGPEATYVVPILSDKTGPASKANHANP